MITEVKICGVSTAEAIDAAVSGGADYLGFNFFPKSPRNVTIEQAAALGKVVPQDVPKVAIVVDPTDDLLDRIVAQARPQMLQLHGQETADRIRFVKERYKLPVIKALALATQNDVAKAQSFDAAADLLLFDAAPPDSANSLPGGNGVAFDWDLVSEIQFNRPWILSGGLNPENVVAAMKASGAARVDVSSGVETAPGVKDPDLIRAFLKAAKTR